MQPIGPLMMEHRLIERMIALMRRDLDRIRDNVAVDPEFAFVDFVFIDTAVDFLRTYAHRCHHGKEEDILFAALAAKDLSPELKQTMADLTDEHLWSREATDKLVKAKEKYLREEPQALEEILRGLTELTDFYPKHLDKEDRHFFIPCLAYFTPAEQEAMLRAMAEFDRKMIHELYRGVVDKIENRRSCSI